MALVGAAVASTVSTGALSQPAPTSSDAAYSDGVDPMQATPTQREQFLVAPFVGFPKLLWRIIRDANKFAGAHGAPTVG